MVDCCEIVDISQESSTEDDLFTPDSNLLTSDNSLLTPEASALFVSENSIFSQEKDLLSTEHGFFTPEKGIFTTEPIELNQDREQSSGATNQPKVPRPPNAFMLYANEHRKTMSHLYPADSNKDISKRLGTGWKSLSSMEKHKYFQRAKAIDSEHKRKYPDYVYNPKEARIRKAIRDATKNFVQLPAVSCSSGLPARKVQFMPPQEQNLIMANPITQLQQNGFFGNCSESLGDRPEYISQGDVVILATENQTCDMPTTSNDEENPNLTHNNQETSVDAPPNIYLPLSCTKFSASPDLFTNSAQYHKEYIAKYFQNIPEYEILNITTEDGGSFPYVTIPKLNFRQNFLEKAQNKS